MTVAMSSRLVSRELFLASNATLSPPALPCEKSLREPKGKSADNTKRVRNSFSRFLYARCENGNQMRDFQKRHEGREGEMRLTTLIAPLWNHARKTPFKGSKNRGSQTDKSRGANPKYLHVGTFVERDTLFHLIKSDISVSIASDECTLLMTAMVIAIARGSDTSLLHLRPTHSSFMLMKRTSLATSLFARLLSSRHHNTPIDQSRLLLLCNSRHH